jgi:glycosyltransferase involved in cell wall biosynthesis
LKELIENENLRTIFGDAIYETISEQYAPEKVIKQYLNWLKTV